MNKGGSARDTGEPLNECQNRKGKEIYPRRLGCFRDLADLRPQCPQKPGKQCRIKNPTRFARMVVRYTPPFSLYRLAPPSQLFVDNLMSIEFRSPNRDPHVVVVNTILVIHKPIVVLVQTHFVAG